MFSLFPLSVFRPPDSTEASRDELHIRKTKLDYQEVCTCSKEAQALWERKLTAPGRTTNPQDKEDIYRAVCQGEREAHGCVSVDWNALYKANVIKCYLPYTWFICLFFCRSSKEQTRGGLVTPFPSASAAAQTAPAPASSRHPLLRPAEAAHRTAARHSGGLRWACSPLCDLCLTTQPHWD